MKIDFKITAWERVYVPDDREEEILKKLKSGEINCADDIYELDNNDDFVHEILVDTTQQILQKDNEGNQTIYAFDDTEDLFSNA